MSREWTPAQSDAINSRNGTVLVSAAAGSGKTAVLVQRVIERLTAKVDPTPVENLLVVTFTKAAAAEMRERISKTLGELIEKNPNDAFLKRQKMFLPNASISTMDSFCSKLVKENFQSLDIMPDFTMMSDDEHKMFLHEIVSQVLDEIYEEKSEENQGLLELFSNGKNDKNLVESIISIYDFAMAAPFPEKWIEEHFAFYNANVTIEDSIWGKYTLDMLLKNLKHLYVQIDKILIDGDEGKIGEAVKIDLPPIQEQLSKAISLIENNGEWNEIKNIIDTIKFEKFKGFKADEKDELFYDIKGRRDAVKDEIDALKKFMCCNSEDFYDDMKYLRPIMNAFKNCVLRFYSLLLEKKLELNSYYFSDILHMTLNLLIKVNEKGEIEKTELARELSESYDEILIDEFQDTNEAQNFLFDALSKNSDNKFMVGDVKQSIYRFRQAMPEIFISFKDRFEDFKGNNYPAKISLDRNFRSRKGIVDSINFFFDNLMSREMGDIDYKCGEQLVFAADYSETDNADTEVHIVEAPDGNTSNLENESIYIAQLINKIVSSGMTVGRKGEEHPVKYGDICILMRSLKNKASIVARELSNAGIPVHYKKSGGFFANAEIVTMISLLRVIDNPVQDVPLMSVMLSPMFPFTEDDIVQMRCNDRHGSLYTLLKSNYETDEKVKYFLDVVSLLRTLSVTLSVSGLIRRILEITAYDSVVGAMSNGEKRVMNLHMLIDYADAYEKNGIYGLSGFIRYVDKLRKNDYDLEDANLISEADNVVRIMSIHKSKGLEFPIVIVANCSSRFFKEHDKKALVDKSMGVSTLRYDKSLHKEFETQPFVSLNMKNDKEELSEAMRLLYVAMTRAKEKLYLVGSLYNPEKAITSLYHKRYTGLQNNSVALSKCSSFMQWILLSMLNHPSMKKFINENGLLSCITQPTESNINFVISPIPEKTEVVDETIEVAPVDELLLENLEERINYVYPYAQLSEIAIKYTASGMDEKTKNLYIASENPAFMGADELTPAQRGTLMHRFMEKCDLIGASKDVDAEARRLLCDGVFNELEVSAINTDKIQIFFKSPLYERILSAERFVREQEFTMSIPVSELNPELDSIAESENAIVQGVIDGLIINDKSGEIVDYKTDRVSNADELIEKYKKQMQIYKKAAEECFGLENVSITLYSFGLSEEISVKV